MQLRNVMLVGGSASFSTRDVWDGYREGLAQVGVEVLPYPTFSMLRVLSPEIMGNDIIGKALDVRNGLDAVIFIDGLYFRDGREWVPETLQAAGMPTILVPTDDPYDPLGDTRRLYTIRFTNEIECVSDDCVYLPTAACLPTTDRPLRENYDVAFIGTIFEDRWPLLRDLAHYCQQHKIRFLLGGHALADISEVSHLDYVTVQNETIAADYKWRVYAGTKVVLNLFRDTEQPANSPNPRVFEVALAGGAALLTGHPRSEVSRIFGDSVYEFDSLDTLVSGLEDALADEDQRLARVKRAQAIVQSAHLYQHRARTLVETARRCTITSEAATGTLIATPSEAEFPVEERVAWIIGAPRTGSTWLNEMLGDLNGLHSWHEPYFGRLFRHLYERPEDRKRVHSFYYEGFEDTWIQGVRSLFFEMTRRRLPHAEATDALVVKEVNTPEFYPCVQSVFPSSRLILLVRDPFDVVDSHLDMLRDGSWNKRYGQRHRQAPLGEKAQKSAEHIGTSLQLALEAYEAFPASQRLMVRYEDLVDDPATWIGRCASLIAVEATAEHAQAAAQRHKFEKHEKTGTLEFRRYGKPGVWQESENFSADVKKIAEDALGRLRANLGYVTS